MIEEKIIKNEILKASKVYTEGLFFKRSYSPEEALKKVEKFVRDDGKRTIVLRSFIGPDYLVIEEPKYEVRILNNGNKRNKRIEIQKKIKIKEIPLIYFGNKEKPVEEFSTVREVNGKKLVLFLSN
ncbi:MAG: hypothetical protein DRN88_05545 [Candidatus Hydrothermarchaeota archaeon]|nr:MAG: hypothetical protein DRN88_05545 [Candidatus Hydrothermarchaeota archaeon]